MLEEYVECINVKNNFYENDKDICISINGRYILSIFEFYIIVKVFKIQYTSYARMAGYCTPEIIFFIA